MISWMAVTRRDAGEAEGALEILRRAEVADVCAMHGAPMLDCNVAPAHVAHAPVGAHSFGIR